jgi:Vacuolar protein sorting-associated protein 62
MASRPSPRRGFWSRFVHAPWWVHLLIALGVLLIANVVAIALAAVFFVDFVHEHRPLGPDVPRQSAVAPDDARELAQTFAPVLRLHPRELFVPISNSAYVEQTQLKEEEGKFTKLLDAAPTLLRLPAAAGVCLLRSGCQYFLDVRGAEPNPPRHSERLYGEIENHLLRSGADPTVYYHVTHYDDEDQYAVQYWFLYLFNYRLNEHESDWEQITLRLDGDKHPIDAFYSAHSGGHPRPWSQVEKARGHPVDYPALGSHANYFEPGRHRVQIVCKRVIGRIGACLRGRKFVVDLAAPGGKTLTPDTYTLSELGGPLFIGSYGSGNYVVLTRKPDVLADPRARSAWADPLRPLR